MSYSPSATDGHNSPRGGVARNVQNSKGLGSPVTNDFAELPTLRNRDEDTTKHLEVSNIPSSVIADGTLTSVNMSGNSKRKEKKSKRQYSVRNKNRPKRPLSAYNLFFRYERERIVRETLTVNGHANANVEGKIRSLDKTRTGKRVHRKTHGAIGFAELGKHISEAWKSLDEKDRVPLQAEADKEKERYLHQLGAMAHPASNDHAGKLKRGADDLPLEVWNSSPTHANEKNKSSSNLSEYYDREHDERIDMEETVLHHHPGYNYYPPVMSPPGHYPPATYFDYHGCYGNERLCAPSAFVPPHPNGPGSPPGHATPQYPPYFGYQLPTPNKKGDSIDRNPQQPTAHAFSPPYPTHQYNRHTNLIYPPRCPNKGKGLRRADNWASESKPAIQRDFAFQCEVCNNAVFSTFLECAAHEEECVKNNVVEKSWSRQKNQPQCVRMSEDGNPGSHSGYKMSPLPNSMQAEAEEQQQAVEAVMMLKKPIEC